MWRGGAALVVAVAHASQIFGVDSYSFLGRISSAMAAAAVMAFFAISGFFIHKSLARCYDGQNLNWRAYLEARVDRIILPFAVSLFLTVILWVSAPHFFKSGTREFITETNRSGYHLDGIWHTALFLNNFFGPAVSANGPLWSLTYEVWYYALACLFVMAIIGRRTYLIAIPILVTLTALDVWFAILGCVWLGGFLVSVLHSTERLPKLPRVPYSILPMAFLMATLVVPANLVGKARVIFELSFGLWMILHIALMLLQQSAPRITVLVWSGSFSYTLYVIHFPILLFWYGVNESGGIVAVMIVITLAALIGPSLEKARLRIWLSSLFKPDS